METASERAVSVRLRAPLYRNVAEAIMEAAEHQLLSTEIERIGTEKATAKGVYKVWLDIATELRAAEEQFFMTPVQGPARRRAQAGAGA